MRQKFKQAVLAFQSGDLPQAATLCEQLLIDDVKQPDALQLLGVVLFESGEPQRARERLDQALALRPDNADLAYNYGSALLKHGDFEDAIARFDQALVSNPQHFSALNNKGNACKELGQTKAATAAYQAVLNLQPDHVGAIHNLGNLAAEAGDPPTAETHHRRALGIQANHPGANFGLAAALIAQGRYREAVAPGGRAVQLSPDESRYWSAFGNALVGADRLAEALEAHQKAVKLDPDSADAWNNLGSILTSLERMQEAEHAFQRALEIEAVHQLALGNLAALYELGNRLEDCESIANQGLKLHPDDVALTVALAKCRHRQQDHAAAEQLLGPLADRDLDPRLAKDVHFTFGQVLDKLDQPKAAFEQFKLGNEAAAKWWQAGDPEPDRLAPALASIAELITAQWGQTISAGQGPSAAASPIFLLGFQRSGATLLDTILGAHGGVLVMEEQPVINRVIAAMNQQFGQYPGVLAQLDDAAVDSLRDCYWQAVGELSDWKVDAGQRLLDKSPLHTIHLGLIKRLFPEAPIILALRHPLDVCLSCFMQDFTMTPFMTHFLTVEGVAAVYVEVMGLWRLYREYLSFHCHLIRYEDLVEDTEGELRKLLKFIELPWRPKMMDYVGHAHSRGLINTPSYHQVTQPVYKGAKYRWLRYREELEGVMGVVEEFIADFGYSQGR